MFFLIVFKSSKRTFLLRNMQRSNNLRIFINRIYQRFCGYWVNWYFLSLTKLLFIFLVFLIWFNLNLKLILLFIRTIRLTVFSMSKLIILIIFFFAYLFWSTLTIIIFKKWIFFCFILNFTQPIYVFFIIII